jgi:hypothetical protein
MGAVRWQLKEMLSIVPASTSLGVARPQISLRWPERVPSNLIRIVPAEESDMDVSDKQRPNSNRLHMAGSDVDNLRELPPLAQSFPNSHKVEQGELGVPFREIALSNGEPSIKVYDTTGPQGV